MASTYCKHNPPGRPWYRPCWDCYFLGLADAASARGDCIRKAVGAVLVGPDHRVIGTGYNGSEPGQGSCKAGGCERCLSDAPHGSDYEGCIEKHAEYNAIPWNDPVELYEATMYVTFQPCDDCMFLMRNLHIGRIVWPEGEAY